MDVPVYNIKGDEVAKLSIDEASLGGTVNPALIKQAYVMYHANLRQGSARTKTRHEVEGSTKKMYRQKGTGNARPGPIRTPLRKGGGHAFAKTRTREDFRLDMPVKMRRKANRNALLAKLLDGEVRVLDSMSFGEARTKDFVAMLGALGIDRSCLVAVGSGAENAVASASNVPHVETIPARELTCFEMLNRRFLLIAREDLEAWLTGPSSRIDKSAKAIRTRSSKEAA